MSHFNLQNAAGKKYFEGSEFQCSVECFSDDISSKRREFQLVLFLESSSRQNYFVNINFSEMCGSAIINTVEPPVTDLSK